MGQSPRWGENWDSPLIENRGSPQGVKIRSRALITTLWARLVLGDLFLHGIGGAKYDQLTDLLIERFFGLAPPGFMVLSATLHLPIEREKTGTGPLPKQARNIAQRLRDLAYHPERCLDDGAPTFFDDPRALIVEKARWIAAPQTPESARTRCRAIRDINTRLQPWVADQHERLLRRQEETARALQAEAILAWREYGFCLYPEETLKKNSAGLLHKNA